MKDKLTVEKLVALIEETCEEDVLDDTICEFKAEEASRINNEGIEAQVAYLLDDLGTVGTVLEELILRGVLSTNE